MIKLVFDAFALKIIACALWPIFHMTKSDRLLDIMYIHVSNNQFFRIEVCLVQLKLSKYSTCGNANFANTKAYTNELTGVCLCLYLIYVQSVQFFKNPIGM